jgi:hypothetical protein
MRFTPTAAFGANLNATLIDILLIGGGGGGGSITGSRTIRTFLESSAGGGAGGYVSQSFYIYDSSSFSLTVGNGGVGGCLDTVGEPCGYATSGENSILAYSSSLFSVNDRTITAYGGGYGGGFDTINIAQSTGGTGGSGGGNNGLAPYGQGFAGGVVDATYAAGGGGASAPGNRQASGNIGGGDGKLWLDGNYYAGGGGAGSETYPDLPNSGGIGGGGRGGFTTGIGTYSPNGTAGTANTGGGGGGKGRQQDSTGGGTFRGGNGGSGICKIRYYGSGSIFNAGSASYNALDNYTYVTFTGSVSFKNF